MIDGFNLRLRLLALGTGLELPELGLGLLKLGVDLLFVCMRHYIVCTHDFTPLQVYGFFLLFVSAGRPKAAGLRSKRSPPSSAAPSALEPFIFRSPTGALWDAS